MTRFEEFDFGEIVQLHQSFFAVRFKVACEQIVETALRQEHTHRVIVFVTAFVIVIIVVEDRHFHTVAEVNLRFVGKNHFGGSVVRRSGLHFGIALRDITGIYFAFGVCQCKINNVFTLIPLEDTVAGLRGNKSGDMILMGMCGNDVFDYAVRDIAIEIGGNGCRAALPRSRVDQNINVADAAVRISEWDGSSPERESLLSEREESSSDMDISSNHLSI